MIGTCEIRNNPTFNPDAHKLDFGFPPLRAGTGYFHSLSAQRLLKYMASMV